MSDEQALLIPVHIARPSGSGDGGGEDVEILECEVDVSLGREVFQALLYSLTDIQPDEQVCRAVLRVQRTDSDRTEPLPPDRDILIDV